ncbi:class I adenylate-forming enzyme family protein [Paraburkholderia nemoris]|uniref:class I adenylate-forming enzyme family protein n=1 Tax=Paraburkholderia nemoris TaxID=2793076 RepID=UPI0038BC9C14
MNEFYQADTEILTFDLETQGTHDDIAPSIPFRQPRMNISRPLSHHAVSRADHPALIEGDRVVRYGELDALVSRTADHLSQLGMERGDVVGVALSDSIDHVVTMFALARSGLVMLPLDWRWTPAEQVRVAVAFGAAHVLTEQGALPLEGCAAIPVDDTWHDEVAACDASREWPDEGGPLLMSLSSGTTGSPKGPCLTHEQFWRRFFGHWINLGFNAQDVYVSATPLYYGGGRTFAMLLLYSGGTVVLFSPPYKPPELCEELARRGATATFLVPTLLRRLLTLDDEVLAPMRNMRLVLSSGAALYPEEDKIMRERICAGLVCYYSSSEGGGISYMNGVDADLRPDSVGRPVFGVTVQCVDDTHQPLASGEVGRIRYRGPAVASGYHNDVVASAEAFRDGWYYPGDLGMIDAAGYLFLKGRSKDMIIRGGVNVYPGEIEAFLNAHPAVRESSVVGWPSREFNEEIAAFVILQSNIDPEQLRQLCRGALAPYKVPRQVFVVDELPRNALGKVLKADLTARLPQL